MVTCRWSGVRRCLAGKATLLRDLWPDGFGFSEIGSQKIFVSLRSAITDSMPGTVVQAARAVDGLFGIG